MKKILLLLTISLACILSHAQQIDRSLFYGRWKLYSMYTGEQWMYRDSMAKNIKTMKLLLKANDTAGVFTSVDSLEMVDMVTSLFDVIMTFDRDGHTTAEGGGKRKGPSEPTAQTGTYIWASENKITQTLGSESVTFVILDLTATRLRIVAEKNVGNNNRELTFTRAK